MGLENKYWLQRLIRMKFSYFKSFEKLDDTLKMFIQDNAITSYKGVLI